MFHSDLFDPYDRLVAIEVLGRAVEVPERNRLLRCFQFLSLESISMGDFCWNGDCTNCQIWYRDADDPAGTERTALACRFDVREGMSITRLNPHVRIAGVTDRDEAGASPAPEAGGDVVGDVGDDVDDDFGEEAREPEGAARRGA